MASSKQIGTVLAIAAAAAVGVGGLASTSVDVPNREEVAVSTIGAPRVLIDDPQDLLSPEDEARMQRDAERLDVPDTVTSLRYLVLGQTRENVNDSVEEYMRDNHPEDIGNDKFADGVLILGAGTDQRKVFAFAGEDVADQLYLREGQRLEAVNDAMKPGMRDNNIPAALFAGASTATDAEGIATYRVEEARSEKGSATIGGGIAAGTAAGVAGAAVVGVRNRRRKAIAQGREDYELVTREYAQLGQRLDAVDIRANSLTSAFAQEELRRDWAEVRDRFLGMHEAVSGAGGIGSIDMSDDKQVWANRAKLAAAGEAVRHASTAEENINRLFDVERGDPAARRADLTSLRSDVMRAAVDVKDPELKSRLRDLEERINWLDQHTDAPDYMDEFVRVLGDYQVVLDLVRTREFSDVKDRHKLVQPRVYDTGYHYPGFVPYVALSSWHDTNVQAAQQASSSGTNSSFSSGFSGAGGSSSY